MTTAQMSATQMNATQMSATQTSVTQMSGFLFNPPMICREKRVREVSQLMDKEFIGPSAHSVISEPFLAQNKTA